MLQIFCGEDGPEILNQKDRAAQCEPKTTLKLLKNIFKKTNDWVGSGVQICRRADSDDIPL